jgi:hypothetical protein
MNEPIIMVKRRALGRGLGALIRGPHPAIERRVAVPTSPQSPSLIGSSMTSASQNGRSRFVSGDSPTAPRS